MQQARFLHSANVNSAKSYASLRQLDGLTGETTADDILNQIFSTFCIEK